MPASRASSTAYCTTGLSTTGSISFGTALVAGRKRVPMPATGRTALRTGRGLAIAMRRLVVELPAFHGITLPPPATATEFEGEHPDISARRGLLYRLPCREGIGGARAQ